MNEKQRFGYNMWKLTGVPATILSLSGCDAQTPTDSDVGISRWFVGASFLYTVFIDWENNSGPFTK